MTPNLKHAEYRCPKCPGVYAVAEMPTHYKRRRHRMSWCRGSGQRGILVVAEAPSVPWREAFKAFETKLAAMQKLRPDWNSYGAVPPNNFALSSAWLIGTRLYEKGLRPSRVVPIAGQGGVAIYMFNEVAGKRADIEVDNNGDVIVTYGRGLGVEIFAIKTDLEFNVALTKLQKYFEESVDASENLE